MGGAKPETLGDLIDEYEAYQTAYEAVSRLECNPDEILLSLSKSRDEAAKAVVRQLMRRGDPLKLHVHRGVGYTFNLGLVPPSLLRIELFDATGMALL